jgi:hypothetical protein
MGAAMNETNAKPAVAAHPPPIIPCDVDLRDFRFMPLDVVQLQNSETWAMADGWAAKALVNLWTKAWHQVPAGSLPDNGISSSTAMRSRLPARRASETFSFEVGGLHYHATISRFPEGDCVAEVFLSSHKLGSQADASARDAAVAASLALQYGCPLDVLRGALLRDSRDRPATPLGMALDITAEQATTSTP